MSEFNTASLTGDFDAFFSQSVGERDPEVAAAIANELYRQQKPDRADRVREYCQ